MNDSGSQNRPIPTVGWQSWRSGFSRQRDSPYPHVFNHLPHVCFIADCTDVGGPKWKHNTPLGCMGERLSLKPEILHTCAYATCPSARSSWKETDVKIIQEKFPSKSLSPLPRRLPTFQSNNVSSSTLSMQSSTHCEPDAIFFICSKRWSLKNLYLS